MRARVERVVVVHAREPALATFVCVSPSLCLTPPWPHTRACARSLPRSLALARTTRFRYTWSRHVEKNRRDVEERTEQLKVVSQVAALLAGFAVIGLAEFEIEEDVRDREWLITLFGVTTGVIVGLMTLSTVICTYMLAGILRVGKTVRERMRMDARALEPALASRYLFDHRC